MPLLPHTSVETNYWSPKAWQLCLGTSGVGVQTRGAAKITEGWEGFGKEAGSSPRAGEGADKNWRRVQLSVAPLGGREGEKGKVGSAGKFLLLSVVSLLCKGWLPPPTGSGPKTHTKQRKSIFSLDKSASKEKKG